MSKKEVKSVIIVSNIFTGELGVALKDELDPASVIIAESGVYTRGFIPNWRVTGEIDAMAAETSLEIQALHNIHIKHCALENNIKRYLEQKKKKVKTAETASMV